MTTEHEHHQGLGSLYVDLSPRLSTSLPGDHSLGVNPIMAQPMIYQRPSIGPSSHFTTPCASWGYHVEFPSSAPQHALPHGIPQGMPLRNHDTQLYSTMNAHPPYDPLWCHKTEAYHGLLGQYHTQVIIVSSPICAQPFMVPTGCRAGGPRIVE